MSKFEQIGINAQYDAANIHKANKASHGVVNAVATRELDLNATNVLSSLSIILLWQTSTT